MWPGCSGCIAYMAALAFQIDDVLTERIAQLWDFEALGF
jgi:hypothetical protein